ncbi:retrotransposon protein, putative, ty1-copia subclass, partial [Tanacetum coccineum]
MFEISGNNFNDWFLQLKMVLRVERKLFVIEQPISLASPTDSEYLRSGMRYMIHNKVDCLMLGRRRVHVRELPAYLAELIKKKKQVGTVSSSNVFIIELFSFPTKSGCMTLVVQLTLPYTSQHNDVSERRNRTLLGMVRSMTNLTTLPLSFWDYALEFVTRILIMLPTKKVDKTPYELCGRAIDLKEIQDANTSPSEITSKIPMEVEGFEPPQEEEIPIRRSERTRRAPNHLCLNVEAEEYSLGDLNEPTNYKASILDFESNKWIDAMNAEIQSMMDNMVWVLVDLPPGCKTVE